MDYSSPGAVLLSRINAHVGKGTLCVRETSDTKPAWMHSQQDLQSKLTPLVELPAFFSSFTISKGCIDTMLTTQPERRAAVAHNENEDPLTLPPNNCWVFACLHLQLRSPLPVC